MEFKELKDITCCGIVLYNPDIDVLKKNIDSLISQVDKIVLIDNNSSNKSSVIEFIRTNYSDRVDYIQNSENFGIAKALNQILYYAESNSYIWYITMDQDSCCSETLVQEYAKVIDKIDDCAVLCPFILNNNKILLEDYKKLDLPPFEFINQPVDCITSGALNNVKASISVKGYNDDLFIDCVDVEFNIKLLQNDLKIARVNQAYMFQSMGESKLVPLFEMLYRLTGVNFFGRLRYTPVYNDIRLYYISRNSKYIYKKYNESAGKRMTPKWMTAQFAYYFLTYPLKRNRLDMFRNIIAGRRDAANLDNWSDI